MLSHPEQPAEGARPQSSQQETSEPASSDSSGEASTAVDEVALECQVCHETIPAGQEFTEADYGPVHTDPCSHQSKELGEEDTGIL